MWFRILIFVDECYLESVVMHGHYASQLNNWIIRCVTHLFNLYISGRFVR